MPTKLTKKQKNTSHAPDIDDKQVEFVLFGGLGKKLHLTKHIHSSKTFEKLNM
jgi:hypothetical protein